MEMPPLIRSAMNWVKLSLSEAFGFMSAENSSFSKDSVSFPAKPDAYNNHLALRVISSQPLQRNTACQLAVSIVNPMTGNALTEDELAVVHTQKLHLLIADESLKDYHHIHPSPSQVPGVFICDFIPATNHGYHMWADVTDERTHTNHTLHQFLAGKERGIANIVVSNTSDTIDGTTAQWSSDRPIRAKQDSILTVHLRDGATGQAIRDLQPLLGAYAHLVGFSADGRSMVHCHPLEGGESDGVLRFHINSPHSGLTQFYLQINRAGKEITLPFGCAIAPALTMQERLEHNASSPTRQHSH